MAKNVFGEDLQPCCLNPITGFYRNGRCDTAPEDLGMHTVCVIVTKEFLEFSRSRGNDLLTPIPEFNFPGLKEGNKWCLCMSRWVEAWHAGMAPMVDLRATHITVLEHIEMEILEQYAVNS